MTSHEALVYYGDNFTAGQDAVKDFVAPVLRPIAVKDRVWEFLRMQPIQEAMARSVTVSIPRASATAQSNLDAATLPANVFVDDDRILFEFPRTGFLDPISIQLAFNLRCFITTHNNAERETFNYDITTMFTRIRLLYNEQEIEDIQRADLLAHIQSCLFDTPGLAYSQVAALRGKHLAGDPAEPGGGDASRRCFFRRNYHSAHGSSGNTQPFGQTRRYMIPLPLGLFRQKKVLPLHLLNGQLRVELTVARFPDVHYSSTTAEQPLPHVGRIEVGRPVLHAKLFKQGMSNIDGIFDDMLQGNRLVYGFQSFQYNQFPIPLPVNVANLVAFQKTQVFTIPANMKYARYLIAGITLAPNQVALAAGNRYVNMTSTHLHSTWLNVQTKLVNTFHQFQLLRKLSQLYSFQLTFDGTPLTPEIKCSTQPCKYWKTTLGSATEVHDNPSVDDVSTNVVEPFFYYSHAVPSTCAWPVLGRNTQDFFQGFADTLASNINPGVRNDIWGDFGAPPLIMVVPLSTVLPSGDVAALSLGSGNEALQLTLKWNTPDADVLAAAAVDGVLPIPMPPPLQLNTFVCYDRLLTLYPDSSITFEE